VFVLRVLKEPSYTNHLIVSLYLTPTVAVQKAENPKRRKSKTNAHNQKSRRPEVKINNNNNRISIAPYGRNFRGVGTLRLLGFGRQITASDPNVSYHRCRQRRLRSTTAGFSRGPGCRVGVELGVVQTRTIDGRAGDGAGRRRVGPN